LVFNIGFSTVIVMAVDYDIVFGAMLGG